MLRKLTIISSLLHDCLARAVRSGFSDLIECSLPIDPTFKTMSLCLGLAWQLVRSYGWYIQNHWFWGRFELAKSWKGQILRAIENYTVGAGQILTDPDKVIYVADYIEHNQSLPGAGVNPGVKLRLLLDNTLGSGLGNKPDGTQKRCGAFTWSPWRIHKGFPSNTKNLETITSLCTIWKRIWDEDYVLLGLDVQKPFILVKPGSTVPCLLKNFLLQNQARSKKNIEISACSTYWGLRPAQKHQDIPFGHRAVIRSDLKSKPLVQHDSLQKKRRLTEAREPFSV